MTNPVPGRNISTPYGRRGRHWSCNRNSSGEGVHTGADWAAPKGTKVVAMRPGTVRHVNFGSAFGNHQVAITGPDGTVDFYAHMCTRVPHGRKVKAGDKIGEVGAEGNATGPHLHVERHKNTGGWNCSNHTNPKPSIEWEEDVALSDKDIDRIAKKVGETLPRKVWMYEAPQNSEDRQRTQKMLREIWEKVLGKKASREPDDG